MKKIYILGNFSANGISGNDSADLDSYMELGWEQVTTGFWAKLNLTSEDYICTARDRLFMYSHITKNLVAWEDFHNNHEFKSQFEIVPIYQQKFELLVKYSDHIKNWPKEMTNALGANCFPTLSEQDYVCVQIRRRSHCQFRNGPTNEWEKFVWELSKKYSKVYVAGKGNNEIEFPANVECVTLEKFCSLVKSDGCKAAYGSSSGCMMLTMLYGRKDLPVQILWTEDPNMLKTDHILFFDKRININKINVNFYFDFELLKSRIIN